jgi:2-polyprenyl-6-methoxyphenol hydroxylase-like FAD-dependent oxidoreductase
MSSPVLIVGAGPVGLTLAIELARFGVPFRIIDKAAQRTDKSKALVMWSRSLELLEPSGVSHQLVDAGYKVERVAISADKRPVGSLSFEKLPTAYPFALMIPQSDTERVLEEFLNGLGVQVEREVELLNFEDDGEKVSAKLRHADGEEEDSEASWLVGCDGAHSTVRHLLGKEFHGETSLVDWLLADIHLLNVPRTPEIGIGWHSDGVLATFPIGPNRYRIVADVGTAHDSSARPAEPTLEDVQAVLDKRFPGGARAVDPVWLSSFRINERKVADYRGGRAFLAGDAAHVHSPMGGQGMNTGMQDVCNLAWKLALVVQDNAAEAILDSYSAERSPIAKAVLGVTGRITSLATIKSTFVQSIRNQTASLLMGLQPVTKFASHVASELSIGYPDSPLNARSKHLEPYPGERAPIPGDEPNGIRNAAHFAIFGKADGMPPGLLTRFESVLEPSLREPFAPGGLWVVRPDGYTALSAKVGDWQAVSTYFNNLLTKGAAL